MSTALLLTISGCAALAAVTTIVLLEVGITRGWIRWTPSSGYGLPVTLGSLAAVAFTITAVATLAAAIA